MGRKKGGQGGKIASSLNLELLRMGLCIGELQGGVSGCRSTAILPSGSFNSLQLDTSKKLLIPYRKLSLSAVLATMHLVCSAPLAIKLFLSDYSCPRQAGACGVRFRQGIARGEAVPRSEELGTAHRLHFLELWGVCKR